MTAEKDFCKNNIINKLMFYINIMSHREHKFYIKISGTTYVFPLNGRVHCRLDMVQVLTKGLDTCNFLRYNPYKTSKNTVFEVLYESMF